MARRFGQSRYWASKLLVLACCVFFATADPDTPTPTPTSTAEPAGGGGDDEVAKRCPLSLEMNDPPCANGGHLLAEASAKKACSECVCPSGWAGVECAQCSSDQACRHALGRDDATCDKAAILPIMLEDMSDGAPHRLSCRCGSESGDPQVDAQTNSICGLQPLTSLTLEVRRSGKGEGSLRAVERAGVSSQDPNLKNGKYAFAAAAVWAANFTACSWGSKPCEAPLEDAGECWFYSCQQTEEEPAAVACPPPGVEPCPQMKWDTNANCGQVPGEGYRYYQHHCMTMAIPMNTSETALQCPQTPRADGSYQCYLYPRANVFVRFIGLQCTAGSCVHPSEAPPVPPAPPAPPPPPPPRIPHSLYEPLSLALLALMVGASMLAAGAFVASDIRDLRRKARAWHRRVGNQPGRMVTPAAGGAGRGAVAGVRQPLLLAEVSEQGGLGNETTDGGDGNADDTEDSLGLSDTELDFSAEEFSPHATSPAVLTWEGVSYTVYTSAFKRKQILRNVSGICGVNGSGPHGCLLAVLGPSGAGKTSLMDCLAGRREGPGVRGEVRLNGHLMDGRAMRRASGYVQQEDVLPGTATVWEYLWFIARLRLPDTLSVQEREQRVSSLIQRLHLEKVAHNFIGDAFVRGLSGGEKRRVSIAAELITRPSVIMLDEATTGLDSTNASRVVDILSDLARQGVAVVLTIHQPRSDVLALLDRVVLMSGNGQVVYSGPIDRALTFFADNGFVHEGVANPADWMLDVVIKSQPGIVATLVEAFEVSRVIADDATWMARMAAQPQPVPPGRHEAGLRTQLRCLSLRLLRNSYRHPFLISVNLLANLGMALLVASVFYDAGNDIGGAQNRLGVLFFLLLFLSLMSLSSLPIWHEERLLFRRERDASTYGTSAYFVAVYAFDILPLRVLPPTFFGLLAYQAIGLHPGCAACIWWFVVLLVLANVASATCSMAIGAATSTNSTANLVGSLFIMLSSLFAGIFINKDSVPWWANWMKIGSMWNYATEALAVNEFHDSPLTFEIGLHVRNAHLPTFFVRGAAVLDQFSFRPARFALDVFMLLFILAVSAAVTYALLLAGDMRKGGAWELLLSYLGRIKSAILFRPREDGFHRPLSMTRLGSLPRGLSLGGGREGQQQQLPAIEEETLEDLAEPELEGEESSAGLEAEVSAALGGAEERVEGGRESQSLLRTSLLLDGDGTASTAGAAGGETGEVDSLQRGPDLPGGLRFGGTQLLQDLPRGPGVCLLWEDIRCVIRVRAGAMGVTDRLVLDGISGVAGATTPQTSGSSCAALMGPSGAGKTTLLDVLAGRRTGWGVSGDVRFDGRVTPPAMRMKMSGYVLQDDVLPGTSSVLEYLMFHAQLRLPANMPRQQRVQRVMNIIQELSLIKVMHTYIGDEFLRGLSGGEKRRVSIAAELLTRPGVLFLDEPTTGLDSTNAANVVDLLARLASGGVTVMMSLHQPRPDILRLIERVTLMSKTGRVVYSGPMAAADGFFERLGHASVDRSIHVIDHMLDVVIKGSTQEVKGLIQAFDASGIREEDANVMVRMQYSDAMTSIQSASPGWLLKYEASSWAQLKVLAARQLRNSVRHPVLITLNLGATAFMAFLLGSVFFDLGKRTTAAIQGRFGVLFFLILFQALMSLSSLPLWEQNRILFRRERASGAYSTGPYFTSVVLFDLLPMRCLPPLLFVLITYGLIGLRGTLGAIINFWLVLVLSNIAGATINMAIGAAATSSAVANAVGSIYCLCNILLAGFLRSNSGMPLALQYVSQFSFVAPAYEALLMNEFGYNSTGFRFTVHTPGKEDSFGQEVSGDDVLDTIGFPHNMSLLGGPGCQPTAGGLIPHTCVFLQDVMRLLMLAALHLLATYLLLKFQARSAS